LGPHLGMLINMLKLDLRCTRCCVMRWMLEVLACLGVLGVTGLSLCVVWADNELGAEGAATLGPHLGKLLNLQTLNLACTPVWHCMLWECYGSAPGYDLASLCMHVCVCVIVCVCGVDFMGRQLARC